jgi:hypothetical protein
MDAQAACVLRVRDDWHGDAQTTLAEALKRAPGAFGEVGNALTALAMWPTGIVAGGLELRSGIQAWIEQHGELADDEGTPMLEWVTWLE